MQVRRLLPMIPLLSGLPLPAISADAGTARREIAVVNHAPAAVAPNLAPQVAAPAQTITLVNDERRTIVGLYLSSSNSDDWGENHLNRPLAPGGHSSFTTADGCIADLRIIFDNRAAQERRAIDICRDPPLTVKPGWTASDDRTPAVVPPVGPDPESRT